MPVLCGAYQMTPAEVADQTPAEISMMLEGLDWVSDREWERALFLRNEPGAAQEILELRYPAFRVPASRRVVKSMGMGPRPKPGKGGARG